MRAVCVHACMHRKGNTARKRNCILKIGVTFCRLDKRNSEAAMEPGCRQTQAPGCRIRSTCNSLDPTLTIATAAWSGPSVLTRLIVELEERNLSLGKIPLEGGPLPPLLWH